MINPNRIPPSSHEAPTPQDARESSPGGPPPGPQSAAPASSHQPQPISFQQAAQEQQPGLFVEFLEFLRDSKKWWLTPIIIVLLLVGLLVVLSSSVIAPFIYPLF